MTNQSALSSSHVLKNFLLSFDINKKKILEVGGIIDENLIEEWDVEWVSVDPLYTPLENYELVNSKKLLTKIKHVKENITKPLFKDDEFDYIFSCNSFHHINDLKLAFDNFYRWLKEGGILYSHFGPIWSAPDGCHIEAFEYDGRIYNFWQDKLTPFWSHLCFSYEEMINFLEKFYPIDFSKKLAYAIYKSTWINRYKFSQYKQLLEEKSWEIVDFSYSKGIDYIPENHIPHVDSLYEEELVKKISRNDQENFVARDILMVLKKRS